MQTARQVAIEIALLITPSTQEDVFLLATTQKIQKLLDATRKKTLTDVVEVINKL